MTTETAPAKNWFRRHPVLTGLGAFIIFIIIVSSIGGGSSEKPQNAPKAAQRTDTEICVEAQVLAEKALKSPSTAKFPLCGSDNIQKLSDDQYVVTSYVDSQNGFGATLRSNWSVSFRYVETDKGYGTMADLVTIDGEIVYSRK